MHAKAAYVKALADAIHNLHGGRVIHLQTAAVQAAGDIPWSGNVEVFALMGPSESRRCFAWPGKKGEAVVFLSTPEITTPEQAVRAHYGSQSADR